MIGCPVCGRERERTIERVGVIHIHHAAPTGALVDYCIEHKDGRTESTYEPEENPHVPDEYREQLASAERDETIS